MKNSNIKECSYEEFFCQHPDRAKLVYADPENVETFKELAKQHFLTVTEDCEDLEVIRKLKSKQMLLVTKEILMRGVDYRSSVGIDLLLAKTCTNRRSYLQCLGRVCRGTDYGDRYIVKDMEKFHPEFQNESQN